tara:strand:- start:327 stop:1196 length:870 start_codon:yes stop_codon:yes gene_type:complete
MNVYSFYRKIKSGIEHENEMKNINKWKDSWSKYGWNPIVLGMDDIEKDDFFWEFYSAVNKAPTANTKVFEVCAWLLYIAVYQYVNKNDNGLFCHTEYDMVNYGVTPDFFPNEPCYYRHPSLYPCIHSKETWNEIVHLLVDKLTNETGKYILKLNHYHISQDTFTSILKDNGLHPIKLDIQDKIFMGNSIGPNLGLEFDIDGSEGLEESLYKIYKTDRKKLEKLKNDYLRKFKEWKVWHIHTGSYEFYLRIFYEELSDVYDLTEIKTSEELRIKIPKATFLEWVDEQLGR